MKVIITMKKIFCIIVTLFMFLPVAKVSGTDIENEQKSNSDTMVVEFYPIPSPDEILSYINRNNLNYRPILLNKKENATNYNTSFEKRIGFGIYMADLAYTLSFEQTGTAMNYFEVVEKMGREMNLFPNEIETIAQRFINNINQYDSLKNIYTESYILMIDNLEQTSNMGSYVIISAGSLIESIYFALNSLDRDTEDDAYRLRIWNQKLVFEHLLKTAERHLNKNQRDQLFEDLAGVKKILDSYKERPKKVSKHVKNNGTIVLGQKDSTEEEKPAPITELKKEIDLLREKWIKK